MNTIRKTVESFEQLQRLIQDNVTVHLDNAGPFGSGTAEVWKAYIGQPSPCDSESDADLDPNMEVVEFTKEIWQLNQGWTDWDNCRADLFYEVNEPDEIDPDVIENVRKASENLKSSLQEFLDAILCLKEHSPDYDVEVPGSGYAETLLNDLNSDDEIKLNVVD